MYTDTRASELRVLRRLAREALKSYELRGTAWLRLLQYEDNAVYLVTDATGERFVLRVSAAAGHSAFEQRSELLWLLALMRDTTLLLPQPVATIDGAFLATVVDPRNAEPRHCALFRWLPGRPPGPGLAFSTAAAIGGCTAELHRQAERYVPPLGFTRPSWGWDRLFGGFSSVRTALGSLPLSTSDRDLLVATGARVREALVEIGTGPAVWGMTHADLHRGNVLIEGGRVSLIDFDDCGWGYYLLDVATMLSSLQRFVARGERGYAALRAAYLAGYAAVRPLPPDLAAQIDTFAVLRDAVIVNFLLDSDNLSVRTWGMARLAGILERLPRYTQGGNYAHL